MALKTAGPQISYFLRTLDKQVKVLDAKSWLGNTVLSYPWNTNTAKIKVLFIFLKPPSSKVLIKRSLPTYIQGYISEILPSDSSVSVKAS